MKEAIPRGCAAVQRISLAWFLQLGVELQALQSTHTADRFADVRYALVRARARLDVLDDNQRTHLQLRASRAAIRNLASAIDAMLSAPENEWDNAKWNIWHRSNELSTLLDAELAVQNCYLVWPKRAYDVEILAEDGLKLLSHPVRDQLTELEKYDIIQAGRCLAFEVPTAALFHIFRATDSILRRWYKIVTGVEPKPRMRAWGAYISNLRKANARGATTADERILSVLEQVKDLHRNPVIHPEAIVALEDAISFVGIADSLISAMVNDIERRTSLAVADLFNAASLSASALDIPALADGHSGEPS